MLNNIGKQIWNRRKKNIWIALELLFIFCLVWYIVDYFFVLGYNRSLSSNRDINNTYLLDVGRLSQEKLGLDDNKEEGEGLTNFNRLINRLKEHPEVESVAVALNQYSFPAMGSYSGTSLRNAEDTTRVISSQFYDIFPVEDYFTTFRHTTNGGAMPASLSDYNWDAPENIVVTRMFAEQLFPNESAIGKWVEYTWKAPDEPRRQLQIVGVLDDIKRFDYLRPTPLFIKSQRLSEELVGSAIIAFRTKSDIPSSQFIPAFKKEMSGRLTIGDYYLKNVKSLNQIAGEMEYNNGVTNSIRLHTAMMLFFLVNIMICVLGTFWHRVNSRQEEIGIRRALGSDSMGIQTLFLLEGLLLLTLAAIPAMLIEGQLVAADLINTLGKDSNSSGTFLPDRSVIRFLITNAITWIILAGIVVLAIWYPARSAGKISPVEALRDE